MIEIRIHGRGGQGAVVASKVLASAFFKEGKWVQVFPSFGAERRGAPVVAYARVDDREITLRCTIRNPDHLIVLDDNLMHMPDLTQGLKERGFILVNTNKDPNQFHMDPTFHVATVDANAIALRYALGSQGLPIVSTIILGGFAKITGLLKLSNILEAIRENVPISVKQNIAGAKEAYQLVKTGKRL
mgnify:CR=1 FL=1